MRCGETTHTGESDAVTRSLFDASRSLDEASNDSILMRILGTVLGDAKEKDNCGVNKVKRGDIKQVSHLQRRQERHAQDRLCCEIGRNLSPRPRSFKGKISFKAAAKRIETERERVFATRSHP